jgi:hypothetical protein
VRRRTEWDELEERRDAARPRIAAAALAVLCAGVLAACSDTASVDATTTVAATTTTVAATTTTSTSTTTTIPPTTTTTPPIITEGAVVLVANASNVNGAAGRLTSALGALGFTTAKATNAAGNEERLDASKIYYLPDGQPAAESISRLMGGVPIFPMPIPAWITGGTEALGAANVLVMLGNDLAVRPLPGLIG